MNLEGMTLHGYDFCHQAADGEGKRMWGFLFLIMFVSLSKPSVECLLQGMQA